MRSPEGERGSVTAEFAIALPAILACVALCLAAVLGAARYAGLAGSAAAAARLAARGDDPAAAGVAGDQLAIERGGGMTCVTVTDTSGAALAGLGVRLDARACALDEADSSGGGGG